MRWRPPGPLGLGGAPLGNLFSPIEETVAESAIEAAWDAGLRRRPRGSVVAAQ